jgi:hypothetical protein
MGALAIVGETELSGNDHVQKCLELLINGRNCFVQAAKLYCEHIAPNEELKEAMVDAGISREMMRRLEAIGRNRLIPELLDATGNQRKLLRCSIDDQRKYYKSPIEVLIVGGDVLKVKVEDMTPLQIKQVFAGDRIRNIAAQRAWQESGKTGLHQGTKQQAEVFVKAGKLVIPPHDKQIIFDRKTVFAFLAMME